jgi:hypothetical protein
VGSEKSEGPRVLETWQNWDVYHGMHHIGSSLLPSGLMHTLGPNSPHIGHLFSNAMNQEQGNTIVKD